MAAPKVRRVLLTLEVETDAPLPLLRQTRAYWLTVDDNTAKPGQGGYSCDVLQASANVIVPKPARKKEGRRGR